MNYLRKYLRTILVGLVIIVAVIWVTSATGKMADTSTNTLNDAENAAAALHNMIGRDLSDFGQTAPKRARIEENRLLDWRSADAELRKRVVFKAAEDFQIRDVSDDDLPAFYSERVRAMETRLRTTFWKPREIARASASSDVGTNFTLRDEFTRNEFETRLWQLDVLRRVVEIAERFRIAEVSKFRFDSSPLEEVIAMAPSSLHIEDEMRAKADALLAGGEDIYSTFVKDPFTLVYQPITIEFLAGYAEAANLIAELSREGLDSGDRSIGRSLFAFQWKIQRDKDNPASDRVIVNATILAIRRVDGSNLKSEVLIKLLPPATSGSTRRD